MKMFILSGLKCFSVEAFTILYMLVVLQINSKYVLVNARNLEHYHNDTCEDVKNSFSIINITSKVDFNNAGKFSIYLFYL